MIQSCIFARESDAFFKFGNLIDPVGRLIFNEFIPCPTQVLTLDFSTPDYINKPFHLKLNKIEIIRLTLTKCNHYIHRITSKINPQNLARCRNCIFMAEYHFFYSTLLFSSIQFHLLLVQSHPLFWCVIPHH